LQDLSALVAGLSLPSMGAGNTISDVAGHALAQSAPGSESVNPIPDRLDNTPLPQVGQREDYAPLVSEDGSPGTRPVGDPFSSRAGSDRLFRRV
jgi:hypothetical protein